ncbi:hypothetical protein D3C87_1899110 [compost metagenome]
MQEKSTNVVELLPQKKFSTSPTAHSASPPKYTCFLPKRFTAPGTRKTPTRMQPMLKNPIHDSRWISFSTYWV